MPGIPINRAIVPCLNSDGRVLAELEIVVARNNINQPASCAPLLMLPASQAKAFGEETYQLRERGRYEYRLIGKMLESLNISLQPSRAIAPSQMSVGQEERGLIEPGDYCGRLPIVVMRRGAPDEQPLAQGALEVRSFKLNYREHYRGMLSYIGERSAGLLLDCRSATRLRLDSLWQEEASILEQQLEFLRHILESSLFQGAVNEIVRNPHRRLEEVQAERSITRFLKADKCVARQFGKASRRVAVPDSHPIRFRAASLPEKIMMQSRVDYLDTAENRFIKMVLTEFRDFLSDVAAHLAARLTPAHTGEDGRLFRESNRLRGLLDAQLSRSFFSDITQPTFLPIGSPVLQRKTGYRDILRFWIQFHASAQLSWDGGMDVYHAGARNLATLYEYWLFFQLEKLFREKFVCDTALSALLVDQEAIPPKLTLRRNIELRTPISGVWSEKAGRRLRAEFHFNRKFKSVKSRTQSGSWTRGMRPDYTISIWPAEYDRENAERQELLVHIHFDAKYRVEHIRDVFGHDEEAIDSDMEKQEEAYLTSAKDADLLKMHAYRDAIRRSVGAYVIYPGNTGRENSDVLFQGFHEVLPGLGAFSVRPDAMGHPEGLAAISRFLDDVIVHLADRSTARERVSYHLAESYSEEQIPCGHGMSLLWEKDTCDPTFRALPPAEEMVLVAWYNNDAQLTLTARERGFYWVRLGRRHGALHVHPNLSKVRSIILHASDGKVAPGIFLLREPGFHIYTRKELRDILEKEDKKNGAHWSDEINGEGKENKYIYAVFKTRLSETFQGQQWDGKALMAEIEEFESDARNRPAQKLGRTSPYPRVLPLIRVLRARVI